MKKQIPLVDKIDVLEKFQGKGSWTFVQIPEIAPGKNTPFGWVRVCGTIEGYKIKNYNLQSMGNGTLFLPVKSIIRNKIKKQEGDFVHIVLFEDNTVTETPEELKLCLIDVPNVYDKFLSYSDGEKRP